MADTKFKEGNSHNPGGMTRETRAARELLRTALTSGPFSAAWKQAYLNQLIAENAIILKDYADRIGGKPKETVEVTGEVNLVMSELVDRVRGMTDDQILALANSDK